MSADDLYPSLVGWFRDPNRVEHVLDEIAAQSNLNRAGMRRLDLIYDHTREEWVRPAGQRLIRWSIVGPEEVFQYGFQPRIFPANNTYPPGAFNLRSYVEHNHDSIFVSTTQPYRDDTNHLRVWERRLTQATQHRFEYEIFAYGGIDVNRALGVHNHTNQREIAFAGGIRPEMIRSAREYNGTQIIRIWENTHFNNNFNPPGQNPALASLPQLYNTPPGAVLREFPGPGDTERVTPPGTPTQTPPHHDPNEFRRRRSASNDDGNIAMFPGDQGEGVIDTLYDTRPVPTTRVASVTDPADPERAYFFCGNRCGGVIVNPGTTNDKVAWGPKNIVTAWPSIWEAGFSGGVDAVLPKAKNSKEMYFFSTDNYALINVASGHPGDSLVHGPKKIFDGWPSLKQANFPRIDAVLPHPVSENEAYFFYGTEYVLIHFNPDTTDDYIVNGPKPIHDNWPSLKAAGFSSVKTVLPSPSKKAEDYEAYFFTEDKYVLINWTPGKINDTIVNGPKPVSTEWPSLRQVGFW